jgi:hypothetical protein
MGYHMVVRLGSMTRNAQFDVYGLRADAAAPAYRSEKWLRILPPPHRASDRVDCPEPREGNPAALPMPPKYVITVKPPPSTVG